MRVDGRKPDEVQDGLRTGVNIDGKCPVMDVFRSSLDRKEGGLIVAMPPQHSVFEGAVAGEPLVVEQGANIV